MIAAWRALYAHARYNADHIAHEYAARILAARGLPGAAFHRRQALRCQALAIVEHDRVLTGESHFPRIDLGTE